MSDWDSYKNPDGTITLCYLVPDRKWGNWGEAKVTIEEYELWKKGDSKTEEEIMNRMR